MSVQEIIAWVISSGGAMFLAYKAVEAIAFLRTLAPEPKRYAAFALAFVIANALYMVGCALGYTPFPVGIGAWIETLVMIGSSAIVGNQTIHAREKLAGRAPSEAV